MGPIEHMEAMRRTQAEERRAVKAPMKQQIRQWAPDLAELMRECHAAGITLTPRRIDTPDGRTEYKP